MKKDVLTAIFLCALVLFLVTPSAALVFDFENPEQLDQLEVLRETDNRWKLTNNVGDPFQLEIVNGALRFTSGGMWNLIAIKDFQFTNGTIYYKMKWLEGGWCQVGVFYRLQETPHLRHYQVTLSAEVGLDAKPEGLKWLDCIAVKWNGMFGGQVATKLIQKWEWKPVNQWFEVKIEVKGGEHTVFAGPEGKPKQVIEIQAATQGKGRVGLLTYSPTREVVLIDDLEIISSVFAVETHKTLASTWGRIKADR